MSSYFNGPFRTSLLMAQSAMSLLHLYLSLEFLPRTPGTCLHIGLALVSFLFSSIMTDHDRKSEQSAIKYGTIAIAMIWLLVSMATSIFIPTLKVPRQPSGMLACPYASPLPALWNEAHQVNAITWSASAFLSVIDLLNLVI